MAKKIKLISSILVILLIITSCSPSLDTKKGIVSESEIEVDLGKIQENLLELVDKNVNDSQVYLRLADIYLQDGDFTKAIEVLNKGLEYGDKKDQINLKIGQIYLELSDSGNAKKYLMEVKEKSEEMALSLLDLSLILYDKDFLDNTFNGYKDMDLINNPSEFFEKSLLAYLIYSEKAPIKEVVNMISDLNLKIKPESLVEVYNRLIKNEADPQEYIDLAEYIIEKEIYNKEMVDFSLILGLNKNENKKLVNIDIGYFTDKDRLDIVLLYGINYSFYYEYLEIEIIDGKTGRSLSSLKEETINAYMYISTFDLDGQDNHILALWGHPGGSGTPSTVHFYKPNNEVLNKIKYNFKGDVKILFRDDFEYEIKSESLGIRYLLQLKKEDILYHISEGNYDHNGKLLVENNKLGGGYEASYTKSNLTGGDYVIDSLGLKDDGKNDSYLATVESYCKFQGDDLVLVDLVVETGYDGETPFNYKEADGYEELDYSEFLPKKENLLEDLEFYLSFLHETEGSLKQKIGKPRREDYYGNKYLEYDNFLVFVGTLEQNNPIYAIWTTNLLGMENNEEKIVGKYGLPEDRGYDDMNESSYLQYFLEDYIIEFINLGQKNAHILMKIND